MPLIDPTTIAGLTSWTGGATPPTPTGGPFSSWPKNAGSVATVTYSQATGANQPILASISGLQRPDFADATDTMVATATMANLLSSTAFTRILILRPSALTRNNAAAFNNHLPWADSAAFTGESFRDTGYQAYVWDGAERSTAVQPVTVGQLVACASILGGGELRARAGASAWSAPVACGAISAMTGNATLARNPGFFGAVAEILTWNVALTQAQVDAVVRWLRSNYHPTVIW